jgi:hypothetical protein
MIQKNLRNVNCKGLKLTLKNIGRFLSPIASGANLRGKYQHFGLNLFKKILKRFLLHKIYFPNLAN